MKNKKKTKSVSFEVSKYGYTIDNFANDIERVKKEFPDASDFSLSVEQVYNWGDESYELMMNYTRNYTEKELAEEEEITKKQMIETTERQRQEYERLKLLFGDKR